MSNQRPGKRKPASMSDQMGAGMKEVLFFKYAKEVLEQNGNEDAAFYFEQMETWLREGNSLPTDGKYVARALGV
jgi:ABC-type sugar transport system substrate-binding protein